MTIQLESVAKTKWCPFVRMALTAGMAANKTAVMTSDGDGYANIHAETRCMGAGCMAWQIAPTHGGLYGDCGLSTTKG